MTKKYIMVDYKGVVYVMTEEEYRKVISGEVTFKDLFD